MLNTTIQHVDHERAYNSVRKLCSFTSFALSLEFVLLCFLMASLFKILYLEETASFGSASRKLGRTDRYNQPSTTKKDTVSTWTSVSPATSETFAETRAAPDSKDTSETNGMYREMILGHIALVGDTSMFRHVIQRNRTESSCQLTEMILPMGGEEGEVARVHSLEYMPVLPYETNFTSLNVPPMVLFYPNLLFPELPRTWFQEKETMSEETWSMEFAVYPMKPKKEGKIGIGLAEAINSSILSAGVAYCFRESYSPAYNWVLTEAMDNMDVLQSKNGGDNSILVLGILNFGTTNG